MVGVRIKKKHFLSVNLSNVFVNIPCEMSSENENEIERTWMKIADVASKVNILGIFVTFTILKKNFQAGYREGAGAGRDEAFQRSFDDGYFEGFKNGFILGKYKGTLRFKIVFFVFYLCFSGIDSN